MEKLVNLEEMAKILKRKPDEVIAYVEGGAIKPGSYCYPAHFGDGKEIAFYPEKVLADVSSEIPPKPEKPKAEKPSKEEKADEPKAKKD
jgi:hypothetical protein